MRSKKYRLAGTEGTFPCEKAPNIPANQILEICCVILSSIPIIDTHSELINPKIFISSVERMKNAAQTYPILIHSVSYSFILPSIIQFVRSVLCNSEK